MEFAGNLRDYALPDILDSIESGQRTGRLTVTNGALRAAIYCSVGQWLLAERSGPGQLLAQQFVKAGIVSPAQIETATSVSFGQAGAIPDVQLVRALMTARMVTQEQLRAFAVNDALALLSIVLTWVDGDFAFDDNVGLPAGKVALPLPIGPLVNQALQRVQLVAPTRESVPVARDAIVDFVDVDPDGGSAVQLTRDQWRLLTAVDGISSVGGIATTLQAPEGQILQLAGELAAAGVLQVVGREPGGR
jgi:hypothetical protein